MSESTGILSVVVPHLNQPVLLEKLFQSLAAQEGVQRDVEVVISDNGSQTPPTELCERYGAKLVSTSEPGPGPARNVGIAASKGEIVAFIDADCIATPGWLAAIETGFQSEEKSILGGDVRVSYADPSAPRGFELYEAIFAFRNREYIKSGFSGAGNMAIRREVFDRVGPFAGIGVAEDKDWGLRATALGIVTSYQPGMVIFHPARDSFDDLKSKWSRHIDHEYAEIRGMKGALKWAAKTVALPLSPFAAIPRILQNEAVTAPRERLAAFGCLFRMRAYRARRMLAVALARGGNGGASQWNRP